MDRLVLCTGNAGKVAELRALLGTTIEVLSLHEVGLPLDLPETGDTLQANALEKARFAYQRCNIACLADDTGLEVDALHGAPGVFSARYAGEEKDASANIALVLREMIDRSDRKARFRTVLALVTAEGEYTFEGIVEGSITRAARGSGGFGYDPIFQPVGHERTFAEMDAATKNSMSHRALAMRSAMDHLTGLARR
ncbi:MAG TPA: RdgB/HAM1 family non-canonical purine NTP pyrophosphatase [Flavobacteriales bacterium]|nr:RdgB/HAM1 family non-canonical purine NTP pyrophosphatase [Flavobacteriales bacterium]